MGQHTKEDLAQWIYEYGKHYGRGPQALSDFFNAEKPPLQTRVNIFLHRFIDYALPSDGLNANPVAMRRIFTGWASTLVGPDAHPEDTVDGGYDMLIGYVNRMLRF